MADGFTGNVILKTSEGTAAYAIQLALGALATLPTEMQEAIMASMASIQSRLDPEKYGGAYLVGVKGVVIIAHGSSSRIAIANAIAMGAEGREGRPGRGTRAKADTLMTELSALEAALGYTFDDISYLQQAMVHRSYGAEVPGHESNERFEFLGDTVLQLIVTDFIFHEYTDLPEGELAKIRAASVNRSILYEIAQELGVGEHLLLGKGEEASGGRSKPSILADAMEAILAAVYLDSDLLQCEKLIMRPVGAANTGAVDVARPPRLQDAATGDSGAAGPASEVPDHRRRGRITRKRFTAELDDRRRTPRNRRRTVEEGRGADGRRDCAHRAHERRLSQRHDAGASRGRNGPTVPRTGSHGCDDSTSRCAA